jgi:hypothetical protein
LDPEQDETPFYAEDLEFLDGTDSEDALDCTLSWGALIKPSGKLRTDLFNPDFVDIAM